MANESSPKNGMPHSNGTHGPSDGTPESSTLTTRQGDPIYDNQNIRTVGSRGPTTLENYPFIEKITPPGLGHFR